MIVYGPNDGDKKQEKDKFWNKLQEEAENSRGIPIVIGDMNGRVGNSAEDTEGTVEIFGEEEKTINSQKMINFCILNGLVISKTWYQDKKIQKCTIEVKSRNEIHN